MFTICIPIYNYDVVDLVHTLHGQALRSGLPFEILLMDDASEEKYREKNSVIDLLYLHYIQLPENVGRSRIRNLLGKQAQYPYLIFMDCDSEVPSEAYIANYVPYFKPAVVCYGGCIYHREKPRNKKYFRWKYGRKREAVPAEKRKKEPNYSFKTGNFLIYKFLLKKNPFNEELTNYGHEDTLFGIQLLEQGISIQHIDNPLIHIGLEDAEVFVNKTDAALCNLWKIDMLLQEKYPCFVKHSSLMRLEKNLEKLHLMAPVALLFSLFRSLIRKNLTGNHPSLFLFDLYKLGALCRTIHYSR
jgi:glycosyltransferase involved in cell wall biosynthesis